MWYLYEYSLYCMYSVVGTVPVCTVWYLYEYSLYSLVPYLYVQFGRYLYEFVDGP